MDIIHRLALPRTNPKHRRVHIPTIILTFPSGKIENLKKKKPPSEHHQSTVSYITTRAPNQSPLKSNHHDLTSSVDSAYKYPALQSSNLPSNQEIFTVSFDWKACSATNVSVVSRHFYRRTSSRGLLEQYLPAYLPTYLALMDRILRRSGYRICLLFDGKYNGWYWNCGA